jgi:hypothetical protein
MLPHFYEYNSIVKTKQDAQICERCEEAKCGDGKLEARTLLWIDSTLSPLHIYLQTYPILLTDHTSLHIVIIQILESVGVTERTIDAEYEHYTKNFNDMMEDMNESGACITSTLLKQKDFFEEAVELSESLVRIYDKNSAPDFWPNGVAQKLTLHGAAHKYRDSLKEVHTEYR